MSEPKEVQDVQTGATPEQSDATPKVEGQQEVVTTDTPDPKVEEVSNEDKALEATLAEKDALNKRYLEQIHGKDKQIEQLRTANIAKALQPSALAEQPVDDFDEVQPTPQATPTYDPIAVNNAIKLNKLEIKERYGSDNRVPYNKDVADRVEEIIDGWDPSGLSRVRSDVYDAAYKIVRGEKLEEIANKTAEETDALKQKEIDVLKKKESEKAVSAVETATKSEESPTRPPIEDVISGKVKLTTTQMLDMYPELTSQFKRKPQ